MAPGGFVAARDDLARRLRSTGRRDDAAAVKRLRRPTVAAWALNQLSRRVPDDVRRLILLGEELRLVQQEVLAGGDRDRLRAATRARRSAVAGLADAALGLLAEEGRAGAEAHRDEVMATLEAASLEAGAGAALLQGRLASGLAPSAGFGALDDDAPAPSPPRPGPEPSEAVESGDDEAARSARLAEAREVATDARVLAGQRRREASNWAKEAATARRAGEAAEGQVERLSRELESARRSVAEATAKANHAGARAADAERAAAAAEAQADAAEAAVARLQAG